MDLTIITFGYNGNPNNLARKTEAAQQRARKCPELCDLITANLETAVDLADLTSRVLPHRDGNMQSTQAEVIELLYGMGLIGTHSYGQRRRGGSEP